MLRLLVLALFVTVAAGGLIQFQQCNPASLGTVHSVDVEGCTSFPCIFQKGKSYKILTTFTTANAGSTANLEVKATVSIITVDIIKPGGGNACPGLAGGCPYTAGTRYVHTTDITISDEFIETDATVTLRILNASNGQEVCYKAPARVTA